jgi:hypothetical protein
MLDTRVQEKVEEIEDYLGRIAAILPMPEVGAGLLSFLETLLNTDTPDFAFLRAAFGFPKEVEQSRTLLEAMSLPEPSVRPIIGILAQRLHHILWRFDWTLRLIHEDWARRAELASQTLDAICEPYLLAHKPTLLDVSAALKLENDLKVFSESTPDPTLFAVLRALESATEDPSPVDSDELEEARAAALDFLYHFLKDLLEGKRQVDDSSNAWWAVRLGIEQGDSRFHHFLPDIVDKYAEIHIPTEDISRVADVPEIYKPIRTACYTLSNVQDILEHDLAIEGPLKERLDNVLRLMLDRLLRTPRSNHLYLASVHDEALHNYLDYSEGSRQIGVTSVGN